MPRKEPLTEQQKEECRRFKALRTALKLSCTNFAGLLGFSLARLNNREGEHSPWKDSEREHAERTISAHLEKCWLAFDETFPAAAVVIEVISPVDISL